MRVPDCGMDRPTCYLVTDIEADGPDPGLHSMLSFGCVAIDAQGTVLGEYAAVLRPVPGLTQDAGTRAWWASEPEAWAQATRDPIDPAEAMRGWADWIAGLPGRPVFVGNASTFDGGWMDWYCGRFLGRRLFDRPREPGLTFGGGLDLPSLVMGRQGWDFARCGRAFWPAAWFGGQPHNHCALDDARGYARMLGRLLRGE
jgi:hypothetical protein